MLEVLVGILLGVASILLTRKVNRLSWLYSAVVISLPLIYVTFALVAADYAAVAMELLWGAPFIIGGAACLLFRVEMPARIVGILWLAHAVFDVVHDRLFVNPGVPQWYPLFCAAVDVVIGGYLMRFASRLHH
ncbi:hypothetical protein D7Z26_18655 [Cohnella endophytica]|uniref:Uncharacterized protein n=1 Tax=Cohnella endophytica TaxID=2419778 RepID=A0A494XQQ7_9BACL|nr:hypothetical protein [Cohnella endophytica]RKP49853.1 hypothetical protein D7Z26_18655 [Cohnella endophytica]